MYAMDAASMTRQKESSIANRWPVTFLSPQMGV